MAWKNPNISSTFLEVFYSFLSLLLAWTKLEPCTKSIKVPINYIGTIFQELKLIFFLLDLDVLHLFHVAPIVNSCGNIHNPFIWLLRGKGLEKKDLHMTIEMNIKIFSLYLIPFCNYIFLTFFYFPKIKLLVFHKS